MFFGVHGGSLSDILRGTRGLQASSVEQFDGVPAKVHGGAPGPEITPRSPLVANEYRPPVLSHLRDLVVVSVVPDPRPRLEVTASERDELKAQAEEDGIEPVQHQLIEAGARSALVAPDDTTFAWLEGRPGAPRGPDVVDRPLA